MRPLDEVFRRMGRTYWPKSFDDDKPVRTSRALTPIPPDEYPRTSTEDAPNVPQD